VEKEKLPWWRWALDFALGGIRSGFGLFRHNGKVEAGSQPTAEVAVAEPEREEVGFSKESSLEPENSPEASRISEPEVVDVVTDTEKSTVPENFPEPESSLERENGQSEVEASAGKPLEVESSPEPEKSSEQEKRQGEVESSGITAAAGEDIEPETPLTLPVEPPEDDPGDLAPTKEETALTNSSPQSDDTAAESAHEEGPAPVPGQTAVPESAPAREAAPALPFDPPLTAESMAAEPPAAEKTTAEKVAAALKARGVDAEQSPFSVFVGQVYDGPLDLLLDLIRKQDIDIYDIPIAKITAQFLAYVDHLRASDMDVAGDFVYTAALLIHIKSKMLLPRAPVGPEESTEDPRRELVDRLLEHERFKNAAQMLHDKQMLEAATWSNPGVREFREDAGAEPEIAADTTDLVRIFRDILDRARNRPILNVEEDSVTVGQMIQFLTRRLTMEDKPVALRRLLSHTHSERALIAMFLGLLELVRLQAILLRQDRQFSEIFVKKNTGFDAVVNEGLASAHDDWR
jgi:segregation and condensation protein A